MLPPEEQLAEHYNYCDLYENTRKKIEEQLTENYNCDLNEKSRRCCLIRNIRLNILQEWHTKCIRTLTGKPQNPHHGGY
jgi:hypothetical protein